MQRTSAAREPAEFGIEWAMKAIGSRKVFLSSALATLLACFACTSFAAMAQDGAAAASTQPGGTGANGLSRIGGDVSAPVLIHTVPPKYPESALKARQGGIVRVNLWVEKNGNPSHVRVVRGLGMDLDESAITAVRQYKFKPAMKNGIPVLVEVNLEVSYQVR